jgi:hypothetical protein
LKTERVQGYVVVIITCFLKLKKVKTIYVKYRTRFPPTRLSMHMDFTITRSNVNIVAILSAQVHFIFILFSGTN